MITMESLKLHAGRWLDRNLPPVEPLPSSLPVWEVEPPYSTPRAACVLMRGEHVYIAGRWLVIERVECLRQSQGPSQTLLHIVGAGPVGSRFDATYPSRDEDEQVAARLGGVA